jgi:hypothetical protein
VKIAMQVLRVDRWAALGYTSFPQLRRNIFESQRSEYFWLGVDRKLMIIWFCWATPLDSYW